MEQTEQLAQRIRQVILNGTLIASTNFKDQLIDSDWQVAVANPGTANTLADLAQHVHYYIAGVLNVFTNGTLEIRDKYSFDFPPISSQDQWDSFLNRFWQDTEALANAIQNMPEEQLEQSFVDKKYGSYKRNIEVLVEHSYYHLGQVVLIKNLLKSG